VRSPTWRQVYAAVSLPTKRQERQGQQQRPVQIYRQPSSRVVYPVNFAHRAATGLQNRTTKLIVCPSHALNYRVRLYCWERYRRAGSSKIMYATPARRRMATGGTHHVRTRPEYFSSFHIRHARSPNLFSECNRSCSESFPVTVCSSQRAAEFVVATSLLVQGV
jgi:hypothetical protein